MKYNEDPNWSWEKSVRDGARYMFERVIIEYADTTQRIDCRLRYLRRHGYCVHDGWF